MVFALFLSDCGLFFCNDGRRKNCGGCDTGQRDRALCTPVHVCNENARLRVKTKLFSLPGVSISCTAIKAFRHLPHKRCSDMYRDKGVRHAPQERCFDMRRRKAAVCKKHLQTAAFIIDRFVFAKDLRGVSYSSPRMRTFGMNGFKSCLNACSCASGQGERPRQSTASLSRKFCKK